MNQRKSKLPSVIEQKVDLKFSNYLQRLAISNYCGHPITYNQLITFDDKYGYQNDTSLASDGIYNKTLSIFEAFNEENIGKPIQIIGYLKDVGLGHPIEMKLNENSPELLTIFDYSIIDLDETELSPNLLPYNKFAERFQSYIAQTVPLLFKGTVLRIHNCLDDRPENYVFYLREVSHEVTPLHIIKENVYSKTDLKDKVTYYHKRRGGIRQYIKSELVKNIGIKGLKSGTELDLAIDFMILQSMSSGKSIDGRYSNKLHSLVIGPPASGKKLLTMIASILNPVSKEIMSTAKKVTPAGLIGNVVRSDNQVKSKPGLLPLASQGVLCGQDIHEVIGNNTDLWGIFSKVMEDGVVVDSTSAKTIHTAITSLHFDMNRKSHLNKKVSANSFEDLNIPSNIISRFDFLMDIEADFQRQFDIVLDLISGEKNLGSRNFGKDIPDWSLRLRRIVAYITTEYNHVTIPASVSSYIMQKFQRLLKANKGREHLLENLSFMLTRMVISVEKYTKAIACSKLKTTVTKTDVDEAFKFIQPKLHFLAKMEPMSVPDLTQDSNSSINKRKQLVLASIKTKSLSVVEITSLVCAELSKRISKKTIDRDLHALESERLVIKHEHGKWKAAK